MTGLVRLGTQQWMVKPAWKDMQQNLLRWFYRAFVNRLGMHLVELYSNRLAIGADQYRRLTRKSVRATQVIDDERAELVVAVAGARDSGKSSLIAALDQARSGDLSLVKARLEASGLDASLVERLKTVRWVEVPGYKASTGRGIRPRPLDPSCRGRADGQGRPAAPGHRWPARLARGRHGLRERLGPLVHRTPPAGGPPALAVVTRVDASEFGGDWSPPYNWASGADPRETAVRARLSALRAELPPTITEVVAAGFAAETPFGIVEHVLPTLSLAPPPRRTHRLDPPSPPCLDPIQGASPGRPGERAKSMALE